MSLDKQIEDLISKSLPEIEAQNLRKYIEQAESDKTNLELARERVRVFEDMIKEKDKELIVLKDLKIDKDNLEKDKQQLIRDKVDFEVLKLQKELEYEKISNSKIFSLVDKIFSNNTIRKSVTESVAIPVDGGSQMAGYVQQGTNTKTEVIEG